MALADFHPVIAHWFRDSVGTPTAAQEQAWSAIRAGRHTLIAAPTGSGKTLAAFLIALDDLLREGLERPLPDQVRVLYVSPLKALSADIHKNLAGPRAAIRRAGHAAGIDLPSITAAVRSGDTTAAERAAILRTPPHILVTTPESLYLLLTAARSRAALRHVRAVIVDEIHAVIGTRRGAHLALSLERLAEVTERPPLRIGLSATQRPIDLVARYLVGASEVTADGCPNCVIVDQGHRRDMDLGLELPDAALDAVMSHEVWEEYYDRLATLVGAHRTTLVFVNTRRMVERVARHLGERLGEDAVAAHHGSLSKERRLDAEARLKEGRLRVLVATASLELGIDIGHVDLVCQIGSPHRIATFLQRVGRAGHTIRGRPKGRLFPTSRDDLIESMALLRAVAGAELDHLIAFDAPLDVLAQQIVAESAGAEHGEDGLFALVRRAWPYRDLTRERFDEVVQMLASGFTTRRGHRGALIHRDEVQRRVIARRAARLTALTSGGAIPDNADYRVVLAPDDLLVGSLNEDFAIESSAGDVFQLGNASWRILQVGQGIVRVEDARGAPPTLPFWLGEAPGRSPELSRGVSDLRREIEQRLDAGRDCAVDWLHQTIGVSAHAARQAVHYLDESRQVLGALPTQQTIVLERFFDDGGGMQLVLHAPFGSRVNRAWGLALRKRFCRQFNFELQAAATEEGLLLSLGPQHSFPLGDVFRYLHPATVEDVLVQAFLDAPVFQTRWRWNATISLAVPRSRGGRRVAPQLLRMQADDLLAAAFPDAAACLENIPGDRVVPDHPLVRQTVRDCLEEAMDLPRLAGILDRIHRGEIQCVARDVPEPSPLCHELLNARPYAFLDDAPLEERRAHAVYARRASEPASRSELGALDAGAIARVQQEAGPDARDADELHDALVTNGFLTAAEVGADAAWGPWLDALAAAGRAARLSADAWADDVWVAAERLPELSALAIDIRAHPPIAAPPGRAARSWTRHDALVELLRGRLAMLGPVDAGTLGAPLGLPRADVLGGLLALEAEGIVLRGAFTPGYAGPDEAEVEWCDRRLLARIHRYTLNRLRAEIEPVTFADYTRFLFAWQHATPSTQASGRDGLRAVLDQLDGLELPAAAWERHVLPLRVRGYAPPLLDGLCFSGEIAWGRVTPAARASSAPGPARPFRSTPLALFRREHASRWRYLALAASHPGDQAAAHPPAYSDIAAAVLELLTRRGALFAHEIAAGSRLAAEDTQRALAELVAVGRIASDGFGGLRAILAGRRGHASRLSRWRPAAYVPPAFGAGGRWSLVDVAPAGRALAADQEAAIELHALVLLRRYGVVFQRLLAREALPVSWRAVSMVYRRLEARGELRGGRFVAGVSGEQYALPEAVIALREVRRSIASGELVTISAADPLNLTGVLTGGTRVAAVSSGRVVYRDGVPLAALEGDYVRLLTEYDRELAAAVTTALVGRRSAPVLEGFVGRR